MPSRKLLPVEGRAHLPPSAGLASAALISDARYPHRKERTMPTIRNGDGYEGGEGLRSREWFERRDLDGFLHRSWLKSEGFSNSSFAFRPVIGIFISWSELVKC